MDRPIDRRRWTGGRVTTLVFLATLLGATGWSLVSRGRLATLRIDPERLRISTVVRGEFQEFVPVVGTTAPLHTHLLTATEGGRVERVFVEAGSMVEQGDAIVELTNTSLLMDAMYREAELFQQRNNLRNTRLVMEQNRLLRRRELLDVDHDLARQQRRRHRLGVLLRSGLGAREEYEEAEQELEYLVEKRQLLVETQAEEAELLVVQTRQLEASLERMEANLDLVRRNLDSLVIRAPVSGLLSALDAEVGQAAARGERIGQIDLLAGFQVRARVDQLYLARVWPGQPATFPLAGRTYTLLVDKVYPEVVQGRFDIDLTFPGCAPPDLLRGQSFHLHLELGAASEAVLLPVGAFYQATAGRWVFVVDDSGTRALRREIRLGRQNRDFLEVLAGLQPGERVVTSSYDRLVEAQRLVFEP